MEYKSLAWVDQLPIADPDKKYLIVPLICLILRWEIILCFQSVFDEKIKSPTYLLRQY